MTQVESLSEFTRRFATVEACLEYLEAVRWNDGEFCPHCGKVGTVYHYSDGRRHRCAECKRVFRITTGTVFSDSPISKLPQWFAATYLVTEHSKGISSVQLAKDIGVTQKTAWRMIQRIQSAAKLTDGGMLLEAVDADESYLGGKERSKRRDGRTQVTRDAGSAKTKAVALGFTDRSGAVSQVRRS